MVCTSQLAGAQSLLLTACSGNSRPSVNTGPGTARQPHLLTSHSPAGPHLRHVRHHHTRRHTGLVARTSSSDPGDTCGDGADEPVVIMSGVSYGSKGNGVRATVGTKPQLEVPALKMKLLSYVASLDRGIAAFSPQQQEVDVLAAGLERSANRPVNLSYSEGGQMGQLEGRWRLVYSSGFGSGSLGGRRPGPPSALVPFTFGQIYQDIDNAKMELDNIVELCFRLPAVPFVQQDPELVVAEVKLGHSYQILDISKVSITFETTDVAVQGPGPLLDSLPKLSVPQLPRELRPPADLRSATFDVTFLDDDMRITRGDYGELRIYVRV
mmetsp:Transcript_14911/g.41898  ORF Transcript_14911/g.41898 Transcript_14911/m.41898 type:complete len:325 (-) Transcript_14911:236-1210(-)|eukprot:CAMPEP_0117654066 /NCGR_PEP_ID=MMETSP0804-20121206/3542_1 /TAXON_ID=1074897 /ORGANISM="Tetraselmis astigmatica, Strain CCMP880" /LENGTH=324 /DNA_ID=CAMNT_0005460315 /DNA_START=192 /DNA_END=1166 /DNA_ORIENTATION=+